jgi:hypothetical protein
MGDITDFPPHRDKELEELLQGALDSGNRVWAIGDIHGYKSALDLLISKLELKPDDIVVCLGDMVDRGPESVGVVETFENGDNLFVVKGNHEEMLLLDWSKTNGHGPYSSDGFWSSQDPLTRERMLSVVRFISSLPTEIVLRDFRLVHAGYESFPYSVNLDEQTDTQRLHSRHIFTVSYPFDAQRTIIVGHTTIQNFGILGDNTVWRSDRLLVDGRTSAIGIDTGIYLKPEKNPRISAIELGSGRVISQRRPE